MDSQDAQSYYELRNPFDEWTEDDMKKATTDFAQHPESGLEDYAHYFVRGGMLNLDPQAYDNEDAMKVSPEERKALDRETRPQSRFDRFRQTKGLYLLVALCSAAAAGKLLNENIDESFNYEMLPLLYTSVLHLIEQNLPLITDVSL